MDPAIIYGIPFPFSTVLQLTPSEYILSVKSHRWIFFTQRHPGWPKTLLGSFFARHCICAGAEHQFPLRGCRYGVRLASGTKELLDF